MDDIVRGRAWSGDFCQSPTITGGTACFVAWGPGIRSVREPTTQVLVGPGRVTSVSTDHYMSGKVKPQCSQEDHN